METGAAVKITYWAAQSGDYGLVDLDGIDEFRTELARDYVSIVRGRPGGLGGGLYELSIQVVSGLTLGYFAKLLLEGAAFDLIKGGAKALVLRPLLTAYKKLKEKNARHEIDIAEFRLIFQDSLVVIRKVAGHSVVTQLERVLRAVAAHYQALVLASGEPPSVLTVPVFEDTTEERVCRFRLIGEIEEPITSAGPDDYFRYWGLEYDYARTRRVYDVERRLLIDEDWYTLERYWGARYPERVRDL